MTHYGCHSKPRSDGYWARDMTIRMVAPPIDTWVWVRDEMTSACQYDQQRDDPKCDGCSRIVK